MKYGVILKEIKWDGCIFSLVFLTILQIFSLEVTLIRDQGWISVGVYDHRFFVVKFRALPVSIIIIILVNYNYNGYSTDDQL